MTRLFDEKKITKTEPVNVLTYEAAYNRLIAFIRSNYWRLEDFADSKVHRDTIRKYRTVERGERNSDSGFWGEIRLNKFLNEIAEGGSKDATCQALLDLVTKKMKSPDGYHFPWCLAKAILSGNVFEINNFEIDPTFPPRYIITLHSVDARNWRERISHATKEAKGRNARFQLDADIASAIDSIVRSVPTGAGFP
jgi:hypothetical protein